MMLYKVLSYISKIFNKKNNVIKISKKKSIFSPLKFLFIFLSIFLLSLMIYFKFSKKILFLSYIILNMYLSYFFLFFYPYERKRLLKYLNVALNEKKEEYIKELKNQNLMLNKVFLKQVILKDEQGYDIQKWNLDDKVSLLIGKSNPLSEVDIDLSKNDYSHLVSKAHGILNKVGDTWYYEDLDSKNGSAIEKKNGRKEKISSNIPVKIEQGDIIYIGIIRLLIN